MTGRRKIQLGLFVVMIAAIVAAGVTQDLGLEGSSNSAIVIGLLSFLMLGTTSKSKEDP